MYDEIVTQIVMVLLETYLLTEFLRRDIPIPIRTMQRLGTAREPKVASHQPTFVPTNNVRTDKN